MLAGVKVYLWLLNVYFTDQNLMQKVWLVNVYHDLQMQKWYIPMDRAQRVDERNGVICLVVSYYWSNIKMLKMAHFLYFLLMTAENQSQFGKIFQLIQNILFSSFRQCYGLLVSEPSLARYQPLKIQDFGIFYWLSSFFLPLISQKR